MLESIGAACHHLGQPAAALLAGLTFMEKQNKNTDRDFQYLLKTSVEAAEQLGQILHELNDISVYSTEPYLDVEAEEDASVGQIIKLPQVVGASHSQA